MMHNTAYPYHVKVTCKICSCDVTRREIDTLIPRFTPDFRGTITLPQSQSFQLF